MPDESSPNAALEIKSASLTVPALRFASNELSVIESVLRERIAQAADFFRDSPVMIDLQLLNEQTLAIDVEALVKLMRELGLVPIGVRGGSDGQNAAALALGIPRHALPAGNSKNRDNATAKATASAEVEPPKSRVNTLITHPVRSGQRVYSSGDLTVTATVSAGAEIMAEGNIHVYGSLRGRALAGVLGDTSSRIFCMNMQAELISIAGIYKLRDDIPKEVQHKAAHVSLDDQMIVIKDL